MFADQTTIPLPALYVDGVDPAVTYPDGRIQAARLWLDTSTGAIGTLKKRNADNDGWDTLINLDAAPPADHATEHQNGGGDEINVAGLSGLLADPQTPLTHTHASTDITDFGEAVEDRIGAKVIAGTGISVSYNDTSGETTVSNTDTGSGVAVTDEHIQDVVGALLADGGVDFTYDDAGNTITNKIKTVIAIACSDETTAITTGAAKVTFRMPHAMTLTEVRASLSTASSSGNPAIDVNEGGASIFSTTLTIDSGEKTSTTAATPAVISDASLADDAEITIDIDTAGTGAKGLKVYLIGTRS